MESESSGAGIKKDAKEEAEEREEREKAAAAATVSICDRVRDIVLIAKE
jgi:hypothetical protein